MRAQSCSLGSPEGDFGCIFLETVQQKGATVAAYSPEEKEEWIKKILGAMEEGKGLKTVCDELKFWRTTFHDWCAEDPALDDRYKRARARGIRLRAEGLSGLAREAIGQPAEVVGAYRLLIDAEKWYISKILPKEFGEKMEIAGDQNAPISIVVKRYSDDGAEIA